MLSLVRDDNLDFGYTTVLRKPIYDNKPTLNMYYLLLIGIRCITVNPIISLFISDTLDGGLNRGGGGREGELV